MDGPRDLWIAFAPAIFFLGWRKLPDLSRSLDQTMSECRSQKEPTT
jgi:Sec-independent protein translocase protein TatA